MRGKTLVEDGRRSVVDEGGPEVDLQGAVTAGRGRAGHRGGQSESQVDLEGPGHIEKGGQTQTPPPLHGRAVGSVPTVTFAKHVVREVCEGHAGPTRAGLVLAYAIL